MERHQRWIGREYEDGVEIDREEWRVEDNKEERNRERLRTGESGK